MPHGILTILSAFLGAMLLVLHAKSSGACPFAPLLQSYLGICRCCNTLAAVSADSQPNLPLSASADALLQSLLIMMAIHLMLQCLLQMHCALSCDAAGVASPERLSDCYNR